MKFSMAALHFLVTWSLKLSDASSQTPRYLMTSLLRIKSPATSIELVKHLCSCGALPKWMNSVLEGFILSLAWSIHCLMLSRQLSSLVMVVVSSCVLPALNVFLTLWSSAKPLNCKSLGTTSWRGEQYRLKMLAPTQLPCGTLTVKSLSLLYTPLTVTLKDLGLRY